MMPPPAHSQPPGPPPWASVETAASRRRPWAATAFALILGLTVGIAAGAGIFYLHDVKSKPSSSAPTFPDDHGNKAKGQVCSVYQEVHKEISTNSARDQGTDPIQQLAVTATIRQAFLAGSEYLLTTLAEQPATPSELATPVRQLAIAYQEVTIGYLNGKTNAEMEPTLRAGDDAAQAIQGLCN
jgi:hypothetical protein